MQIGLTLLFPYARIWENEIYAQLRTIPSAK